MIDCIPRTARAVLAVALLLPAAADAQGLPTGVWLDHTGRGAVEIAACGEALCGHVVWLKDARNGSVCRNQVIGNVRAVGGGVWDRGWIVDPDDNKRYSVELKPIGRDRLRVVGYLGTKMFSETMTWRRAPADLARCDLTAAKPAAADEITVAKVHEGPPAAGAQGQPADAATAIEPALPSTGAPASEPQATPTPPARTSSRGRSKSRTCKLDLPYVTLEYPCDAF